MNVLEMIAFCNRYLDENDNASVGLGAIRALHPSGTVVFVDALSGRVTEKGLLATIGNWLLYGWWQVLILFGVFVYTAGKRLGLAEFDRRKQVGQRELVDALAALWQRSRATEMAQAAIVRDAERRIRSGLKITQDVPRDAFLDQLETPTKIILERAESCTKERLPVTEVLPLARALDSEATRIEGSWRQRSRRPHR